jgi:prepilin-type N-terminal cleavage/methylation domain-containing protein
MLCTHSFFWHAWSKPSKDRLACSSSKDKPVTVQKILNINMRIRGFTLIELMVVISIIGVLSSIALSGLSTARFKAYDSRRIQELKNLSTDLILYRDTYGTNPVNLIPNSGYGSHQPNFLQELVTAGLLSTNIKAPDNNTTDPYYYYDYGPNNAIGMLLVTQLEAAAPSTTGYPGTCRPWAAGINWCDQNSDTYYCICNPY